MRIEEEDLHGVRFFEFLTEEERAEFLEAAEPVSFRAGEVIIREGEDAGSLFVLRSGKVEVSKRVPGGGEHPLAEIDAGEQMAVVGERGLLGESAASATVRAATDVEAVRISRRTFRRMISEGRPAAYRLSYHIARTLAQRLTRLDEEVVETVRELEGSGEIDVEAFRDRLITDWTT